MRPARNLSGGLSPPWLAATHLGNATNLTNPLGDDSLMDDTVDIREAVDATRPEPIRRIINTLGLQQRISETPRN